LEINIFKAHLFIIMQSRNFIRPIVSSILLFIILMAISFHSPAQTNDKIVTTYQKSQIQHKYGLDPATSLPTRIKETPAGVVKMFEEAGMSPRQHQLSSAELLKVEKAFAILPPLHQRVLKEHLRSISFLDNMPNTALTSKVNTDDAYPLYDITFRAEVLRQNVSEWITEKERTCFEAKGSSLSVSIAAGALDAIVYILMHEATHVVDGSLGIIPVRNAGRTVDTAKGTFTTGVWTDLTVFAPQYRNTLLESTHFRTSGKTLPIDSAGSVYQALERTPFVSLYSTSSQHEDLAEYLTVYHFTKKLKQPFQIIIRDKEKKVLIYEPMKSKLVKSRMRYMQVFYANSDPV
jgi:hypothetical protein